MARNVISVRILGNAKGLTTSIAAANGSLAKFTAAAKVAGAVGVAALAAAGVSLSKIGTSLDDQVDKIRVGTGATGDALTALTQSFETVAKSVPSSFDDTSTAIADINTRLGLTGPPLEALSGQFLNLSRITKTDLAQNIDQATRVFGDWGVAVSAQGDVLDSLYRAAQASGVGLSDLQGTLVQFGAPLRNLGFDLDESTALMALWNKTGVNTETVMAGLKAGIGKVAKAGEDVPTTFRRVVDEIQNAGSASEATGLAIELFGQRSGPDLADAIRGGKFELDAMLDSITNGSDTISQAAEDTADWRQQWQLIKNKVMLKLAPLAMRMFNAIGDGMTWVTENSHRFTDAFQRGRPIIIGVLTAVAAGFAAWAVSATAATVATIAALAPVIAIGAAIAAVAAGLVWAYENIDWFRDGVNAVKDWMVNDLWPAVKKTWTAISETISTAITKAREVIERVALALSLFWAEWGDEITAVAQRVWDAIAAHIGGVISAIQGVIKTVTALISGDWSGAWEGIKQIVSGIWSAIGSIVGLALDGLKALVRAALSAVKSTVSGAMDSVKSSIKSRIDAIGEAWSSFWRGLGNIVRSVAGGVRAAVQPIIDAIQKVIDTANKARTAVANVNPFGARTVGGLASAVISAAQNHSGGVVGFPGTRTDEVLTILQRGEGVIDRDTMRNGLDTPRRDAPLIGTVNVQDGRDLHSELARAQALAGAW